MSGERRKTRPPRGRASTCELRCSFSALKSSVLACSSAHYPSSQHLGVLLARYKYLNLYSYLFKIRTPFPNAAISMEKFHLIVPLDRAGGSDTVRISPSKSGFKAARNAPETSGGGGDGCG